MSAPGGAPRPAPRSNSMGPGASGTGIAMPQQSVSQTPIQPAPQTGQSAPPSGTMTTEVVNQISKEERKAELEVRKREGRRAAQQEEAQRRAVPPAQPEMILTTQREHEEVLAPHRLAVTSAQHKEMSTTHREVMQAAQRGSSTTVGPGESQEPRSTNASPADLAQRITNYLVCKGYNQTEAMLRMESAQEVDGRSRAQLWEASRPRTCQGFDLLKNWVEGSLDCYKSELRRILWPLFVYSFFSMITSFYPQYAKAFFDANKNMFLPEHTDDIRHFEPITLPMQLQENSIANLYRMNKYRLVLSNPAYTNLLQFLESKEREGGSVMNAILNCHCSVKTMDRAADNRFSFAAMLGQIGADQTFPAEDEGIPGHHPGSARTGDNPAMAGSLPRLKLGKLPMELVLMEDVRAELAEEDAKKPTPPGHNTFVQEFDQMIKNEDDDEAPTRADIPYPPSIDRDVQVQVMKVMEHRDRFEIKARTGGVGPGVSVCMFTFHNTYDSINCIDFSDDSKLVAAGFAQSYIRIWSLDGSPIQAAYPDLDDLTPTNSRRLIGHSGPVYAVEFQLCATAREDVPVGDRHPTNARWLLSSSADKTVRLWSLESWQCMVVYRGHDRPVWDVRFGPFGHYFVSGGSDKTARLWVSDHIRQQRIFAGHDQDVDVVCFHPNSAYVFTASSDRTVRMWAVTTGNAVRMFTGHTGNVTAMECSRNGKILASADDQSCIILWDLAPGRLLKRMRGHGKGGIWSLSWSMESTVLVSGGADCTVRVWDVAGPQEATQGRVIAEGGAIDGDQAPSASKNKKKKGKDGVVTADQISAFPTKKSTVYKVKFTNMNLVVAGSAYLP